MTLLSISLAAALFASAEVEEPCHPGASLDIGWASHTKRNPVVDASDVLIRPGNLDALRTRLGEPHSVKSLHEGVVSAYWVYDAFREGRECDGSGVYESDFLVEYAILTLSFDATALRGCWVTRRVYVSKQSTPDPFGSRPMAESASSCSDFIRANQA